MNEKTPLETEKEELLKRAIESEKLYKFSQIKEFSALEKLFQESIALLKDISNISKDYEVEVRARQISIIFLEGLLDSIRGSKESLDFYNSQLEKIKSQQRSK